MKKEKQKKVAILLIVISIMLTLISAIGASLIQTDFGKVDILQVNVPLARGEVIAADIYKPQTATVDNPAPCIITVHGGLNNKEMQDALSIEMSRRGYVVVNMDMIKHGHSSDSSDYVKSLNYPSFLFDDADREYYGNGVLDMVDYVYENLEYVDKTRIGANGHSQGLAAIWRTLSVYGRNERAANGITEGSTVNGQPSDLQSYGTNKLAAVFGGGYVPEEYVVETWPQKVNIGYNGALYDEAILQDTAIKIDGYMIGDLTVSPNFKNVINAAIPNTFTLDTTVNWDTESGRPDVTLSNWDNNEKISIGTPYGSAENGTLRMIYNPKITHTQLHFSNVATTNAIEFFSTALQVENTISTSNQVWLTKELFNFIGYIGFFLFIIPFALMMLNLPFFNSLVRKEEDTEVAYQPTTIRQKAVYIIAFVIGTVAPALTFYIFMLLPIPMPSFLTALQPVMLSKWAMLNGFLILILFAIGYFLAGRKFKGLSHEWGIRIKLKDLGKTLLLALITFVATYLLLGFASYFFHVDFRLWLAAITTFDTSKLIEAIGYLPFFFVLSFTSCISINIGIAVWNKKEWLNTLLALISNVGAVLFIVITHYTQMLSVGEPKPTSFFLGALWGAAMIPCLIFATFSSRILYRKTKNVYLAAIINTLFLTMITIANTSLTAYINLM